jgi:hypothetical protein
MKIMARKCDCKHVSPQEAREFLSKNHFMGPGNWAHNGIFGLYYNNQLLSVLTIRRYRGLRFNWDIARYASEKDVWITGGLSKLMTTATKTFGGEIGFAIFKNLFDGHSMKPAGFEWVTSTKSQNFYRIGERLYSSATVKIAKLDTTNATIENFGELDYYRWTKPNYDLSIGYVYRNTYEDGFTYYGQHIWTGIGPDPNYEGSPSDTSHGTPIKIEVIDYAYDRAALNYRERNEIIKGIKNDPHCINKWGSLYYLGKFSSLDNESQEELHQRLKEHHTTSSARENHSKAKKGSRWFTNGIDEIMIRGDPPEGYYPGALSRNKGIKQSPETCRKKSEAGKGHPAYEKQRQAVIAMNKKGLSRGTKLYNNGVIQKRAFECPEGFILGGLPLEEERKQKISLAGKGRHWFNNGIKNVFAYECPEGFNPGKFYTEEVKQRMGKALSEAHKKYDSPEYRLKLSKGVKAAKKKSQQ